MVVKDVVGENTSTLVYLLSMYHSELESQVFVDFLQGVREGSVIVDKTSVTCVCV